MDIAGKLIGFRNGQLIASYGFGSLSRRNIDGPDGTPPVAAVLLLTAENAGDEWSSAEQNTLNAWDFGDETQPPALRYADYDGNSGIDYCAIFPDIADGSAIACGSTLLTGQNR